MKFPQIFVPDKNFDKDIERMLGKTSRGYSPGIKNLEDYIILPGKVYENYSYPDLLVDIKKKHYCKNWYQTHEALHKEGAFMLTIRQYLDFIQLLKSDKAYNGKGNKISATRINKTLNEIFAKGRHQEWNGEWLDARFEVIDSELYMHYNHKIVDGSLQPQESKLLELCLMKDCYTKLSSCNSQGLPTKESPAEEVFYVFPRGGNNVARFHACSNRKQLSCVIIPFGVRQEVGIRAAMVKV